MCVRTYLEIIPVVASMYCIRSGAARGTLARHTTVLAHRTPRCEVPRPQAAIVPDRGLGFDPAPHTTSEPAPKRHDSFDYYDATSVRASWLVAVPDASAASRQRSACQLLVNCLRADAASGGHAREAHPMREDEQRPIAAVRHEEALELQCLGVRRGEHHCVNLCQVRGGEGCRRTLG